MIQLPRFILIWFDSCPCGALESWLQRKNQAVSVFLKLKASLLYGRFSEINDISHEITYFDDLLERQKTT